MVIGLFVILLLLVLSGAFLEGEVGGFGIVIGGLGTFFLTIAVGGSVMFHADDVGTVRAYSAVIEAQEQRVSELRGVLNDRFDITKTDAQVLLNADSPVKAVVESLAEATKDLAWARRHLANAKVDIERRKAGPFWFVVSIYGEK